MLIFLPHIIALHCVCVIWWKCCECSLLFDKDVMKSHFVKTSWLKLKLNFNRNLEWFYAFVITEVANPIEKNFLRN